MLSLQELAERSGIEARTIRSYIEKGLLPGAEVRGPKSYYSPEHLDCLKIIQLLRLNDPATTLQEIRLLLQQLSPLQIRDIAKGRIRIGALLRVPDSPAPPSTALEYLAALKQGGGQLPAGKRRQANSVRWSQGSVDPAQTLVAQLVEALRRLVEATSATGSARRQSWYRFEITPDVELSVRGEFHDEHLAQFQQIADLLRHALLRGVKNVDGA
jgi:DNA-binding transcriptional MerR regulator